MTLWAVVVGVVSTLGAAGVSALLEWHKRAVRREVERQLRL